MGQQYALSSDFEERISRYLNKYHLFDSVNFGILKLNEHWLQVINKNGMGEVTHHLWKIRYKKDTLKEVYQEFDKALRSFAL